MTRTLVVTVLEVGILWLCRPSHGTRLHNTVAVENFGDFMNTVGSGIKKFVAPISDAINQVTGSKDELSAEEIAKQKEAEQRLTAEKEAYLKMQREVVAKEKARLEELRKRLSSLPPGPRTNPKEVNKLAEVVSTLHHKIAQEVSRSAQVEELFENLRNIGALEPPSGVVASLAKPKSSKVLNALSGTADDIPGPVEAPILWFQPPSVNVGRQSEIEKSVKCIMKQIGDENSPAMLAEREYALENMARVQGRDLSEVMKELEATKEHIVALRGERERLSGELSTAARNSSKSGTRKYLAIEKLVASQLKSKDEEIMALQKKKKSLKQIRQTLAANESQNMSQESPEEIRQKNNSEE